VQISWMWSAGITVGLVKPVYLKIQDIGQEVPYPIAEERYTPALHHVENIYGRSSWFKGFGESKVTFGTFLRSGVFFDLSVRKFALWGIEIGGQMDVFINQIALMHSVKERFVFPSLYLQLAIGRRLM
jgi:hypothetical protein